ncbi:MAG: PilZ domain-containing protein [Candidatus Sulfotelmatobacter sp.]
MKLQPQDQPAADRVRGIVDARRRPRFKIEVDITVDSHTCGLLKGHTVDISESGISAMLRLEVPLNEVVELTFTLPFGPVKIHAVVRQRSAFRYGFQFMESNFLEQIIGPTCRQLAVERSPISQL